MYTHLVRPTPSPLHGRYLLFLEVCGNFETRGGQVPTDKDGSPMYASTVDQRRRRSLLKQVGSPE